MGAPTAYLRAYGHLAGVSCVHRPVPPPPVAPARAARLQTKRVGTVTHWRYGFPPWPRVTGLLPGLPGGRPAPGGENRGDVR